MKQMPRDVHVVIEGDDFKMERNISLEMAGEIIKYIGWAEERKLNDLPIYSR